MSHRSTLGEQAFSDIHRTSGVTCTYFDTRCQYSHVDNNQLTDQSINPVFYPCAQSNVQKSQCGSDNYMWQAHNMGSYCFNVLSFQTILDSICVLGSGSSSVGTSSYHSVDLINICNEFDNRLQQYVYIYPTPGSVCAGFYYFQCNNFGIIRLNECCQVPSGQINVMVSGLIPIHMVCKYKNVVELSCDPKVAYQTIYRIV